MPEAARKLDVTSHMGPLSDGPASDNVSIGDMPAWRAVPGGLAAGIEAASNAVKGLMDMPLLDPVETPLKLNLINAHLGQAASAAAGKGAPGASAQLTAGFTDLMATNTQETTTYTSGASSGAEPAARAAYTPAMKEAIASFASDAVETIAGMTDIHTCPAPGALPHGPGVVTKGSTSVFINDLPATRKDDQVFEAAGGPDPISAGCPTVFIGDAGGAPASAQSPTADEVAEQVEEHSQLQSTEAALVAGAASGMPLIEVCPPCERMPIAAEDRKSTFAVRVVDDETNEPVRGVALKITLPDGEEETHTTDGDGEVIIDDLDRPGMCDVKCEIEDAINDKTAGFVRRE